ncbi:hypothetical protein [Rhodovibrio sodomensis]|nr:hypothetical protein [Rhodovibrio sodomensis]
MDDQTLFVLLVGFAAQLIDGAVGVAYGTFSIAALLAIGTPAPLGAWMAHRIPARVMMLLVGLAICALGLAGLGQMLA